MRLGLVARSEIARGLAIQSKGFYDNMPVERVLLVHMPRRDCALADDWYDAPTIVDYNQLNHTLDEGTVRRWLDGLDIVFTVETPNDWRIPTWCREMGVKLVIQGNPEFFRHGQKGYEHLPHPDAWWWPTTWLLDRLPKGPIVPVPMPDFPYPQRGGLIRYLHVMGKRAWQDRNGTDIFCNSLRATMEEMVVYVYGIDEELPLMKAQNNQTIFAYPSGVEDRWTMYDNIDCLVLPRKFGGNCLPALEAAARGVAVMMPDWAPNREHAHIFNEVRRTRQLQLPIGTLQVADIDHVDLARDLDIWARRGVEKERRFAWESVPRWRNYRPVYIKELEKVLQ